MPREDTEFQYLTRSCLYNWLGYGNINAPVWFVGMEEGGAEIWRHSTRSLEESLSLRSTYDLSMDFREVWEDKYGILLNTFRGITVWHYMAAFLLSHPGMNPDSSKIRDFLFTSKELGGLQSDHFLCELLPLPRRSNDSIEGYESIWKSVDAYKREVMPKRFELISDTLKANTGVKLLVSYDRTFTSQALSYYPSQLTTEWNDSRGKAYRLFSLALDGDKHIYLLSTPFFGQGQCSYDGLANAANTVKRLL
jgi:hypothetical protein